jgi:hypothetical protein
MGIEKYHHVLGSDKGAEFIKYGSKKDANNFVYGKSVRSLLVKFHNLYSSVLLG